MAAAVSDVNEVFSRLFDHRPFLKGEIEYFKKEFEEKRGDREVEQLFRCLELTTEIKEAQIDKVVGSSDDNLPRTIADIQVALHMCEDTIQVEKKFATEELLSKKRTERQIRLQLAQADVAEKLALLQNTFQDKELELRRQFESLEKEAGYCNMDHITIIPSRGFICVLQELKNIMGAPEIIKEAKFSDEDSKQIHLTTQDIKWCHIKMRERGMKERIHEMIAESQINLPKYEPPPRNPDLEARIQQLRKEQENKVYRDMTKNLRGQPSGEGIAEMRKEMRSLNRQLVTGLQYILSIVGTFFAIFIGSGLAIPDYGPRVLLAIIVALVVALAELYFLIRDDLREEDQLEIDKNK